MQQMKTQPASIIEMWIVIEARGKSDKEKNVEWQGFTLSFNLIASTRQGRIFCDNWVATLSLRLDIERY